MTQARQCERCGASYLGRTSSRFCSRQCKDDAQRKVEPRRTQYGYDGRLSDALWREIHAARAEVMSVPLYRPGTAL